MRHGQRRGRPHRRIGHFFSTVAGVAGLVVFMSAFMASASRKTDSENKGRRPDEAPPIRTLMIEQARKVKLNRRFADGYLNTFYHLTGSKRQLSACG